MQDTAATDRITLLIGETTFNTTLHTIQPSLTLTRLTTLHSPQEGPYFIDADPDLFKHILRYLRTGLYPLFHTPQGGHDEPQYHALLNQAKFYEIPKLEEYLTNKTYQDAVQKRTWAKNIMLCGERQIEHLEELTHHKNEMLNVLDVKQTREKCFRCPTSNWRHDGRRQLCLKAGCVPKDKAPWSSVYEVEMRVLRIEYTVTAVEVVSALLCPGDDGQPPVPPPYQDAEEP